MLTNCITVLRMMTQSKWLLTNKRHLYPVVIQQQQLRVYQAIRNCKFHGVLQRGLQRIARIAGIGNNQIQLMCIAVYVHGPVHNVCDSIVNPVFDATHRTGAVICLCCTMLHVSNLTSCKTWRTHLLNPVFCRCDAYDLCVLMYDVHVGNFPSYIRHIVTTCRSATKRSGLRSSLTTDYVKPIECLLSSENGHFRLPVRTSGTNYHTNSVSCQILLLLRNASKLTF